MRVKLLIGLAALIIAVGAFTAGMLVERHSRGFQHDTLTSELDGSWKGISWEGEDGKRDDLLAVGTRLTIAGEKVTYFDPYGGKINGLITTDTTQRPKTFAAGGSSPVVIGDHKGTAFFYWAGIYELEGETLKLCFVNTKDRERPTEFKAKPALLLVLKREKK